MVTSMEVQIEDRGSQTLDKYDSVYNIDQKMAGINGQINTVRIDWQDVHWWMN